MSGICVVGTDTGVGKTIVAGLLGAHFLEKGHTVVTQKWVETGAKGGSSDIAVHLRLMQRTKRDYKEHLPFMSPYLFRHASSPHLAARLERRKIDPLRIRKSFEKLSCRFDRVIVEGAGGIFVPLTPKMLLADLIAEMGLPVLLVAANKLGAINHTLLTLHALRAKGIRTIGVIFNTPARTEDEKVCAENPRIIRALGRIPVLGVLERGADIVALKRSFKKIGKRFDAATG